MQYIIAKFYFSGKGFMDLAQSLIKIGADYGHQKIEDVLVSRRTLARSVIPAEYDRIKNELEIVLSENHLAFTTDMWTDDHTKRSFLTLTAHYIDDNFNLKANVLGNREFLPESKTGANILDFIEEMLMEFKIEEKLNQSVIVTDNGSNVVAAFRRYKRLSCGCHNLNLVMEDVLEKINIPELQELITAAKKLVTYFKQSELNGKLTKTLKQHVKTRWNSMYIMLKSIHDMFKEIQTLLIEKNEVHRIAEINFNLLQQVLEFLKQFKCCSEKLSSENVPTIHEFSLWSAKLLKLCSEGPSDCAVMQELKQNTKISLNRRFQSTTIHLVGVFLNPPYKKLQFLSEEQREQVLATVKAMLEEILQSKEDKSRCSATESQDLMTTNHPSTSTATDSGIKNMFDEFKDKCNEKENENEENIIDFEIQKYINKKVDECDVLSFWKDANDLPLLRILSRQVLNIPASSAASERVFSTSGRILEDRRTRLLSENVDQLLFLHKNL